MHQTGRNTVDVVAYNSADKQSTDTKGPTDANKVARCADDSNTTVPGPVHRATAGAVGDLPVLLRRAVDVGRVLAVHHVHVCVEYV